MPPGYLPKEAITAATLVDVLRWRAREEPEHEAFSFLADGEDRPDRVTYGELDLHVRRIAAALQSLDLEGARALLFLPSGIEFIAALLGCLYAGTIAVPAYPPRQVRQLARLDDIAADSGATVALTTAATLAQLRRRPGALGHFGDLRWLATDDLSDVPAEAWRLPTLGADTVAYLQYTSGSTTSPRGVVITHRNLLCNAGALADRCQLRAGDRAVVWLPLHHDMGLVGGVLGPLYGGLPVTLMPPAAFMQRPLRWLRAISEQRAVISAGPGSAYELCTRRATPEAVAGLDLRSWRIAMVGAEPIRPEVLDRFAATFAAVGFARDALYPCYGLAEATVMVSGGQPSTSPVVACVDRESLAGGRLVPAGSDDAEATTLVGCGRALRDVEVAVVDPRGGTRSPDREIGEIWVAGPSVANGYWNRPDETAGVFHRRLPGEPTSFLSTGDLGALVDGELFITGRLKDLIIVHGKNHYPHDIERTAEQSHAELPHQRCAAFAVDGERGEQLVVVQEAERRWAGDGAAIVAAIRDTVAAVHELPPYAVMLVASGSIPTTSSGKLRRRACRDAYLSATLEVLAEWRRVAGSR